MVELADTQDLGSCAKSMQVRPLLPAPDRINPNSKPIGEGFGFFIFTDFLNYNSKRKISIEIYKQSLAHRFKRYTRLT